MKKLVILALFGLALCALPAPACDVPAQALAPAYGCGVPAASFAPSYVQAAPVLQAAPVYGVQRAFVQRAPVFRQRSFAPAYGTGAAFLPAGGGVNVNVNSGNAVRRGRLFR